MLYENYGEAILRPLIFPTFSGKSSLRLIWLRQTKPLFRESISVVGWSARFMKRPAPSIILEISKALGMVDRGARLASR